jgi:four helix bundle protein
MQVGYELTDNFPTKEQFALTSQIRRCAVSIPSNIAQSQKRGTEKEFKQFLRISYGSGAELETQLIIANKVQYLKTEDLNKIMPLLVEIMKMLNAMIRKN